MRQFLATLTLFAAAAVAADSPAAGTWAWVMPGPMGDVAAELTLKVDGETLTGEFVFEGQRKLRVSEGTVKDGTLKFKIRRDRPSGGVMEYAMTGKVDGETLKGSATSEMGNAEWTAKRKP